jgi:hypothetical protein
VIFSVGANTHAVDRYMGLAQVAVEWPDLLAREVEWAFAPGAVLESGSGRVVGREAILQFYRGRAPGFEEVRHVWLITETNDRAFKVAWAGVQRRPGDVVVAGCGVDRVVTDDAGQIVAAWNEFTMPS